MANKTLSFNEPRSVKFTEIDLFFHQNYLLLGVVASRKQQGSGRYQSRSVAGKNVMLHVAVLQCTDTAQSGDTATSQTLVDSCSTLNVEGIGMTNFQERGGQKALHYKTIKGSYYFPENAGRFYLM